MSTYPKTAIFALNECYSGPLRKLAENHIKARISGNLITCVGSYKGTKEVSYMVSMSDFDAYVRDMHCIRHQESILTVTGCNKAYACLEYLEGSTSEPPGTVVGLGSMCQVPRDVALSYDAWTHRPELNLWWIAHPSNPDHSHLIPKKGETNV